MQGEGTYIEKKMAHCNQYFCCLYRTVYNKKRSIYKKPIPTVACQLDFFFLFFSFETKQKHSFFSFFFFGKSGRETLIFLFFLNHFCFCFCFLFFFVHPQPHLNLPLSRGGVSGCGSFIVVWGSMAGGWKRWGHVGKRWGEGCSAGVGGGGWGSEGWDVEPCWGFSRCHFFSQLLVPAHLLSMPLLEKKHK